LTLPYFVLETHCISSLCRWFLSWRWSYCEKRHIECKHL